MACPDCKGTGRRWERAAVLPEGPQWAVAGAVYCGTCFWTTTKRKKKYSQKIKKLFSSTCH